MKIVGKVYNENGDLCFICEHEDHGHKFYAWFMLGRTGNAPIIAAAIQQVETYSFIQAEELFGLSL